MRVSIKSFDVDMEVKNKGIELEIRTPDGEKQLGDIFVTKKGITWCKGRTGRKNGISLSWTKFIALVDNEDA